MAASWSEVITAREEKRRELTLQGPDVSKRIENNGLDHGIYQLKSLNFLDISRTCLSSLTDGLGALTNLTTLILHNNRLTALPENIGNLQKLKILDVSNNALESVPAGISTLRELQSLNAGVNKLTAFPAVGDLKSLHFLNLSHNELDALPEGINDASLEYLAELNVSFNCITEVPCNMSNLARLQTVDLSNNKLCDLPLDLSECPKLKDLNAKNNKLRDRRLGKMLESCSTKAILDYLGNQLQKEREKEGKKPKKEQNKRKKKKAADASQKVEELVQNMIKVLHFDSEKGFTVQVTQAVLSVRPYIVCCILHDLNFYKSVNMFKRFITMQTKLHDGICQKRVVATIATHDMATVKWPLLYDARLPHDIKIQPLSKSKEVTAASLVQTLRAEADAHRKEKKRSTLSGIHKYLDLLADRAQYPCLVDSLGNVISFPPITNSDVTKISRETTTVLVEVTSSTSLHDCRKVMDTFLMETLELGLGEDKAEVAEMSDSEAEEDGAAAAAAAGGNAGGRKRLVVQQVKVVDSTSGQLRTLYPARDDLPEGAGFVVLRDYE